VLSAEEILQPVHAPPLIRCPAGIGDANALLRNALACAPTPADNVLDKHRLALANDRDRRLGRRLENLVALAIELSPGLELVARNLRIQGRERTLGELDMLVYDRARQVTMHWELTIKFYLGLTPEYWPGPNPADSLAGKTRHLFDHQFPLLQRRATGERLAQQQIRVEEQYLFSVGRLFYPAAQDIDSPAEAAAGHWRGQWWHLDALPATAHGWRLLDKPDWLVPPLSDKSTNWLATPEVLAYVRDCTSPVAVQCRTAAGAISETGFIVPRGWPANEQARHAGYSGR
jgi:hypothetical protein